MKKIFLFLFISVPLFMQAQKTVDVYPGEYQIGWVGADSSLYVRSGDDNGYSVVKIPGLKTVQGDGGQYQINGLDDARTAYIVYSNKTVAEYYPVDNLGNSIKFDTLIGIFKNAFGIQQGTGQVYGWCPQQYGGQSIDDIFNQFTTPAAAPTALLMPPGVKAKKIVAGASTNYGIADLWMLGDDGNVWEWDRTHKTPFKVTGGWTDGTVREIAICGANFYYVETTAKTVWVWGRLGTYGGGTNLSTTPQNVTSLYTAAGCVLPSKQVVTEYNTIHILDSNYDHIAAGSNVQGCIGNGVQYSSWRTYPGDSTLAYAWNFANGFNLTSPVKVAGKFKKLYANNSVAFYVYGKDFGDEMHSWGHYKKGVLGDGNALGMNSEAARPEWFNRPAPKKVNPITQSWTVNAAPNINAIRPPIAHIGVNQYLPAGSKSTTVSSVYTHQQQPYATNTITIVSTLIEIVSGPGTVNDPTNVSSSIGGLQDGQTTVVRVTKVNSAGLNSTDQMAIAVAAAAPDPDPIPEPSCNCVKGLFKTN